MSKSRSPSESPAGWSSRRSPAQPGPPIDGVVTTESIAEAAQGATKSYVFAAFLSDTVAVTAEGILPGNPDAEDLLSGMLVKAVDVIRAA